MNLRELTEKLGGEAVGEVDRPLIGVGTIEAATSNQITFLANSRYRKMLGRTHAGAVIVGPNDRNSTTLPRIVIANPYAYFARVAQLFSPVPRYAAGVHPSAVIHADVSLAASASVAEFVSIGRGAVIGERVRLGPGTIVGEGARIGDDSFLPARATLYHGCTLGRRCIVHAGAVIGADGFGFAQDQGAWIKVPQTGGVVIGDDCEIGANTTIDRGAMENTIIGNGVKLDNQIQIGHNVVIGDHTIIAGCVAIAGSTRIGAQVMIGGASAIVGHIEIADHCVISAMTLVTKSIIKPGTYTAAMPFMPHGEWLKNAVHLRKLDELAEKVKQLQARENKGESS